ncbi:MAG: hypothetical protein SFT94_07345 [Pseudanabaenaceae cyanobacterium bins.68]|nr:hypothetical protein [Pseudanabaenaceae cyanobacterium bins.68]
MAKRTARQWIINVVLVVTTASLLGASLIPLVGQIFSSNSSPASSPIAEAEKPEAERVKIQMQGYEDILKTEPDNQFALQQLTNLHLRLAELGDLTSLPKVVAPLDRLAALNPKELGYRLQLGRVKAYLKDKEGAIAEYNKILSLAPGNIDALKSLVSIQLADQKPEAALGILDNAIAQADNANKVQPNSVDKPALTLLKADLYLANQQFSSATQIYDQVAAQNPADFRPVLGKALVARAEGKITQAQELFAAAAKIAPAEVRDQVNRLAQENPPAKPVPSPAPPSEQTPSQTPSQTAPAQP